MGKIAPDMQKGGRDTRLSLKNSRIRYYWFHADRKTGLAPQGTPLSRLKQATQGSPNMPFATCTCSAKTMIIA
jgi:hypothetical protein